MCIVIDHQNHLADCCTNLASMLCVTIIMRKCLACCLCHFWLTLENSYKCWTKVCKYQQLTGNFSPNKHNYIEIQWKFWQLLRECLNASNAYLQICKTICKKLSGRVCTFIIFRALRECKYQWFATLDEYNSSKVQLSAKCFSSEHYQLIGE